MRPVVRAQLDYYAVLEISPSADTVEVNAAFRRLAWRYHPDRNPAPGATLQFQDINEAHQVLSDPVRRAEYDSRWHPRTGHRDNTPQHATYRRRRWHRRHHIRAVALGICAVLFVSGAWAVIFTAMTAAHSAGPLFTYDSGPSAVSAAQSDCGISLELFPVSYVDERGHRSTGWDAVAHNCYSTDVRFSALSLSGQPRAARFANDPQVR